MLGSNAYAKYFYLSMDLCFWPSILVTCASANQENTFYYYFEGQMSALLDRGD